MSEWPWVAIFAGTALALYCGISALVELHWRRVQKRNRRTTQDLVKHMKQALHYPEDDGFYDTERGDY
jgi:hypothetical protein